MLSKVSLLVGDLELDELLRRIAELSIPELADWSSVEILGDRSRRGRFIAYRDPAHAELAARLRPHAPWRGRHRTELLAGRTLYFPDMTDEIIAANVDDAEHLALARQMRLCSTIAAPLRVRDETVAVLTFSTSTATGRRYSLEDLALAEELARRAEVLIERVRLHADLKASDARFRLVLSLARTAAFEQDRELRYRWAYNLPYINDVVGKRHQDLYPPEIAAALDEVKRKVMETGEPFRGERQVVFAGRPMTMLGALEPLRDERGDVVGIIGAATDVTAETQMREELAQAVTFREQLIGILGHDLRNPLNAILAATQLARRRVDLSPQVREHVERIDRSARRMAEFISRVLDFTQARFHGRVPTSPVPTDFAEVARAIVDELGAAQPERVIELSVEGDARGVWDPARLAQVVSNLVGNALVHGAADEPVRVLIEGGTDEVWMRVHNAGAPIAPELMPHLFEPFHRGAAPDGAAPKRGLGLGLYIAREIVLAHDGDIHVESTEEEGTTFTVRLPRHLPRHDEPQPAMH
jgi:signal transduction histidine kinase